MADNLHRGAVVDNTGTIASLLPLEIGLFNMEYDMTHDDVDRKEETKIATVEVIFDGRVYFERAIFTDDVFEFWQELRKVLDNYDEAK